MKFTFVLGACLLSPMAAASEIGKIRKIYLKTQTKDDIHTRRWCLPVEHRGPSQS